MPSRFTLDSTGPMMNRLRNSDRPASTWFGGTELRPSAFRVSERTTKIFVKLVTSRSSDGATASTVIVRSSVRLWLGFWPPRFTVTVPGLAGAFGAVGAVGPAGAVGAAATAAGRAAAGAAAARCALRPREAASTTSSPRSVPARATPRRAAAPEGRGRGWVWLLRWVGVRMRSAGLAAPAGEAAQGIERLSPGVGRQRRTGQRRRAGRDGGGGGGEGALDDTAVGRDRPAGLGTRRPRGAPGRGLLDRPFGGSQVGLAD